MTGLIGGVVAALIGFGLSGLFLAPQLIVGYLGADARTNPRVRTEASSWISTAVNLGAALGAAVFGAFTDITGPDQALVISAAIAGVIIATTAPWLLRPRRPEEPGGAKQSERVPEALAMTGLGAGIPSLTLRSSIAPTV